MGISVYELLLKYNNLIYFVYANLTGNRYHREKVVILVSFDCLKIYREQN